MTSSPSWRATSPATTRLASRRPAARPNASPSSTSPAPTARGVAGARASADRAAAGSERRTESRAEHRHHRGAAAVRPADGRRRPHPPDADRAPARGNGRRPNHQGRQPDCRRTSIVPSVIQYAGGALHYICEAVNPWHDRTLAERGTEPQDIGAAPDVRAAAGSRGRDRGRSLRRALLHRQGGRRLHSPDEDGRLQDLGTAASALVLHNTRPRSAWLFYYQIRNRWHFILKNYQLRTISASCRLLHRPRAAAACRARREGACGGTYVRAVGGLLAMLPSLPRDRAFARRIRRKADRDLLVSAPIVVREDLAVGRAARARAAAYERWLDAYWRVVRARARAMTSRACSC